MVTCLSSREYMHIHNAIVVLQEILPVFPVGSINAACGPVISEALTKCINNERREDLKILAGAYNSYLQKNKHIWEIPPELKVFVAEGPHP